MMPRVNRWTRREPAKGVINPKRPHMTQVICSFEHDTFAAIQDRARRAHHSFSEQVRTLVEWGLEAEKTT